MPILKKLSGEEKKEDRTFTSLAVVVPNSRGVSDAANANPKVKVVLEKNVKVVAEHAKVVANQNDAKKNPGERKEAQASISPPKAGR